MEATARTRYQHAMADAWQIEQDRLRSLGVVATQGRKWEFEVNYAKQYHQRQMKGAQRRKSGKKY
jgi:hypothetical protein